MWSVFTPDYSLCGFVLHHFHSHERVNPRESHERVESMEILPAFFFLSRRNDQQQDSIFTSIYFILSKEALQVLLGEAMHQTERDSFYKTRLGHSRLPVFTLLLQCVCLLSLLLFYSIGRELTISLAEFWLK